MSGMNSQQLQKLQQGAQQSDQGNTPNTSTPDQLAQSSGQAMGNKPQNSTRMSLMKALKRTQSLPTQSGYTP